MRNVNSDRVLFMLQQGLPLEKVAVTLPSDGQLLSQVQLSRTAHKFSDLEIQAHCTGKSPVCFEQKSTPDGGQLEGFGNPGHL